MTRHSARWFTLLLALALVHTACASPPVEEVRAVSRAFETLNAASQPLLDDLALAERAQGRSAAVTRAEDREASPPALAASNAPPPAVHALSGSPDDPPPPPCTAMLVAELPEDVPPVQTGFCVEDSPYFTAIADPPATAHFRRGLAILGEYTRVLLFLAEDGNLDQANAELQALGANVGAVLQIAGVTGAGAALPAAIGALRPLIDVAARGANARELKRLVRTHEPQVKALAVALRDAAPEMFTTITEGAFARLSETDKNTSSLALVEVDRIEAYRGIVSSYVVLLDRYRRLFNDLLKSYERKRGPAALAGLVERSADLAAGAQAWRQTMAALRTGLGGAGNGGGE